MVVKKARDYALRLRHRFSRRAVLIGAGQTGLFGLLLWRLRQLQILDSSEYRLLSDENRITMQLVAPARGSIYDRFGRAVAADKENFRVSPLLQRSSPSLPPTRIASSVRRGARADISPSSSPKD